MDNLTSFTLEDIAQLEGDNTSSNINITTSQKRGFSLNFNNAYEKYIFRTVVYNQLVNSSVI